IYNPLTVLSRNPDTMMRLASNPQALLEFVLRMVEQQENATPRPNAGSSRPGSTRRPSGSSTPTPDASGNEDLTDRPTRRPDTPFGGAGDR
ncbi:MAG: hypothetical protein MUE97_04410, partial [Phycisphaerales bacterium]|nr:hypothetical protein [Phycisphaerales bacterium]